MEKQFDRIPERLKPKNVGTNNLFKSGFMEKLTRTHISVPVTMHLIIVSVFIYNFWTMFETWQFIALFFGGYITWTLS
jgi:hypothetical protein